MAAKSSDKSSFIVQEGRFVNPQESRFQVAKLSDMGNAVMKGLRFPDTQESCFEAWKLSHMDCADSSTTVGLT